MAGVQVVADGVRIELRGEVALLSRNVIIQGDHDERLCPDPEISTDGETKLSCNQFGAQLFFHSPGHESLIAKISNLEIRNAGQGLIAKISNLEIRNAGQAFRLGRYAIHWHMVGNIRESFQKNCSIHDSWNRGTAIHGVGFLRALHNLVYNIMGRVNFLRVMHNLVYNIMGHSFFIEDGVEEYNRLEGNLAVKTLPSMNLLNT
ncbi:hypothetical protein T484DRAFT_1781802, partial [Baffinella frigidus]